VKSDWHLSKTVQSFELNMYLRKLVQRTLYRLNSS